MREESRVKKTVLNARVNLIFYALSLFVSFFTRRIFLERLGDDFVGLTTTVRNLLGFLNLAELGIGGAIGYVLYKPLYDKDESRLNEIISLFGYIYRWIGRIIIVAGVVLSLFLPLIFRDVSIDLSVIYYLYYSFLLSSLLGYFVNYKQTLLGADQKNYVVAGYLQSTIIAKTLLQAGLAYYTQNYFVWATNEIIFSVIFSLILNRRIARTYPWLKSDLKLGKGVIDKYPEVFRYTKQLFVHKIAGFAQTQLTPFMVYAFVSLQTVAMYGNYTIIINGINTFICRVLGSTEASVGNLIAEGDKSKILKVYWELFAIRLLFAGTITFCVYHLTPLFITIWLGEGYVLSNLALILISFNLYIGITRGATDAFKYGYALFSDVWAPIAEALLFVTAATVGGTLWGFEGVLLGGIVSQVVIVWGWHPIFLFRSGLKRAVKEYFIPFTKHMIIYALCFGALSCLIDYLLPITNVRASYLAWLAHSAIIALLFSSIYFVALYLTSKGMRDTIARVGSHLTKQH